jgi:hypothetical protein
MANISRILLVNDTRGAQEYLQRAFHSMGLECDLALFGWSTIKPIEHALNFDPLRGWGALGRVPRPFINLVNVARLKDYDVASYVHRISFVDRPHFLRFLDLPAIRAKVGVMSYTALGCDEIAFIFGNSKLPYKPCATCQAIDDPDRYCERVVRPMNAEAVKGLNQYFDCAVSTAVEYSHIESLFQRSVTRIPLPVDVSEVPWKPTRTSTSGKVKILHTPSRGGFKGTAVVIEAIAHLSKMRDDFEFQVITGVPFNEYIALVGEADIIVDQVWSQSPGMNALWLLCMGKIVLSGNTELARNYLPFSNESPIVNAEPEPMELAQKLSNLISQRTLYSSMAETGREYVMRHHDHIKIANDYLQMWQAIDQP